MINRSRLASQYKSYAKYLQDVRNNIGKTTKTTATNSLKHASSLKEAIHNVQESFTKSNIVEKCNVVCSSSQKYVSSKIQERIFNSKIVSKSTSVLSSVFGSRRERDSPKVSRRTFWAKNFTFSAAAAAEIRFSEPTIKIEPIPEPPPIPAATETVTDGASELINQVNALGEPTFASLGLGGYSPVGLAQTCFEYFHVTLGIPWWEAIVIGTLIIRLSMFPLVIIAQRNAAKMNNYLPQMQAIQLKMTEARQTGNQMDAARYSQELMLFMKEKDLNPLKNMIVPLAQMPVFISFFMGLRQMCNVPVDSLRTGGLWWFTDLTVPDQFFLMPIITSVTLLATIELGTDTAKLSSQNLQTMKYVLRALPVLIIPFTINFPGAILCYWVSTNFISLVQVGILKIPAIRDYFKIERLVSHVPDNLPIKPKGFTEGLKDSWTNLKITNELENRRRLDEIQFQRAGKGPLVKTYKYDPTKQVDSDATISGKK